MEAMVVYDSVYGNTEKIAHAVGEGLDNAQDVQIVCVGDVAPGQLSGLELLIVGSPTQKFTYLASIKRFLKGIPGEGLQGVKVAAFDTRASASEMEKVRVLAFLARTFGYAAEPILAKLEKKGGEAVAPAEGFFVGGTEGPLTEGEIERASSWAHGIADSLR